MDKKQLIEAVLKEVLITESVFPPAIENLIRRFESLYNDTPEAEYKRIHFAFRKLLEEHPGFRSLGSGMFRAAYEVKSAPDFIIKITHAHKAAKMNQDEIANELHTKYPLISPKVYWSSPDKSWYIGQRVHVINADDEFMQYFPEVEHIPKFHSVWVGRLMAAAGRDIKKQGYNTNYPSALNLLSSFNDIYQPRMKEEEVKWVSRKTLGKLLKNKTFMSFVGAGTEFDFTLGDIRRNNVGYVEQGGQKRMVIIDPGIGNTEMFDADAHQRDKSPDSETGDWFASNTQP